MTASTIEKGEWVACTRSSFSPAMENSLPYSVAVRSLRGPLRRLTPEVTASAEMFLVTPPDLQALKRTRLVLEMAAAMFDRHRVRPAPLTLRREAWNPPALGPLRGLATGVCCPEMPGAHE